MLNRYKDDTKDITCSRVIEDNRDECPVKVYVKVYVKV
ncbi:hypothetical protein SAMN05421594_4757 [Chryseobacterium oleae]|uniref:Uncharacterized protein n=1 Tax=Chryseobacterium oleae TaxID=491207 RepID=A0A1I5D0Y2_CHROL|nr:hypothetical protein SAMN05421594_4757 [Chryseobacterium oleae]